MHPFKSMILHKESEAEYLPTPPALIRKFGSNAALLFVWLLEMHTRHADDSGWFYLADSKIRETFGWGYDLTKAAVQKLVDSKFLETKRQGVRGFVHYKIGDCESVVSFFKTELSAEVGKSHISKIHNWENPETESSQKSENPISQKFTIGKILKQENPETGKSGLNSGKIPFHKSENPISQVGKSDFEKSENPTPINSILNKEYTIKNKEEEREKSANLENSRPEQKKSKSQKIDPIEVQDLLLVLFQKYYPNQSKGWGDLLNEYLVKIKYSEKPKAQTAEQFLKNCQNDADRFLNYCSVGKIEDAVIVEYLELAISHAWKSLTKWGGKDGSNYTTSLASIAKRIQAETCKNSPKTNETPKLEVYAQKGKISAPSAQKEPLIITEQMRGKRNSFCFPENRKEWVKNVNSELAFRVTQEDAKRLMLVKDPQKRSIFEHPEHLGFSAAEFVQQGVKNSQEAAAYLSKQLPNISADDAVVLGRVVVEVFGLMQLESKADSVAKNQEIAQSLLANIVSNTVSKSRMDYLAQAF